jgi:hypothetical protein
MSTQARGADGFVTIYEEVIENPLGLHLESGKPVAGAEWGVFVDLLDEGEKVIHLNDDRLTAETARELARALREAADEVEPPRFLCAGMTCAELEIICNRLGISATDMVRAMTTDPVQ